ncbi:MAG: adenosine deaminase, partial [Candidatus Dormibacteraeota bacterium]|nr:adenosine deaminase [Candidatus Dormibacteraeota bacterium]
GLHLTCHAGEAGRPESVEEALDLGVERVAHGVIGARRPRLVERLRSEGVTLDLCPTANVRCRAAPDFARHPLPDLHRAGVHCTISTDSRTVAATTLSQEYRLAHHLMGMTLAELEACNRHAHDARFDR